MKVKEEMAWDTIKNYQFWEFLSHIKNQIDKEWTILSEHSISKFLLEFIKPYIKEDCIVGEDLLILNEIIAQKIRQEFS
ncbi:MAG: hypothetical protein ACFFAU_19140 [Candidatus Hodarchaeota archaeon]